ncbi:lipopolysaccharide transport system permease protein [Thorsellia anophelis DSM 18579]|uniref:Lipopolysaccharide transport system permease protein n=2 Tax=Thorsellia anophelis TaxID=336804 RepID=A0A1I0DXT5_9GAMM|nr:lipopolysaccharide transport system permease protein [Thorsellia anophelis DSM 18579]
MFDVIALNKALIDIYSSVKNYKISYSLAYYSLKQQYRRTFLGVFWITINLSILITVVGFVFSNILVGDKNAYIISITIGLVFWRFITGMLNDGSVGFIIASPLIKQIPLPLFGHALKVLLRQLIILAHSILLIPIILVITGSPVSLIGIFVYLPIGLILLSLNLLWMALFLGVISTKFRDIVQFTSNMLQLGYYITPIIWIPGMIKDRLPALVLNLNPFYHLIELVRQPLIIGRIEIIHLILALSMLILGWILTLIIFSKYRAKISLWL